MSNGRLSNSKVILELVKEFLGKYGDELNSEIDKKIHNAFVFDLEYSFNFDLLKNECVINFIEEKELDSDPSNKKWVDLDSKTRCFIKKLKKVLVMELSEDSYGCSNGFKPSMITIYLNKISKYLFSFVNVELLYSICSKFIGWIAFPFYLATALLYFILCTYGIWVFRPISAFSRVFPFLLMIIVMHSAKSYFEERLYEEKTLDILTDKNVAFGLVSFACLVAYCNLLELFNASGKLDMPSIFVLLFSVLICLVEIKNIYNWLVGMYHELEVLILDAIFILK